MPPTIKTFHLLSIIHNFEGSEGVVNMEISADANKVKGSESEKRDGCSTLKSYFFSAGLLSFLFPFFFIFISSPFSVSQQHFSSFFFFFLCWSVLSVEFKLFNKCLKMALSSLTALQVTKVLKSKENYIVPKIMRCAITGK